MPQVPFTAFYLGPTAVYPAYTGLQDPITGAPELGGNFLIGNYCDLSEADARIWNAQFGTTLHQGRYRIVHLASVALTGYVGLGRPVAWALGTSVQQVSIANPGFGYTTGTFTCVSSTSGGTTKATIQVVIGGANNSIISATVLNPGSGFTSVPTFSLSELSGGSSGSVLAQMTESANEVTTWDSSAISLNDVRGVFLGTATAAQITAGAYVVIQEEGIAPVFVTTATNTAAGVLAYASGNGAQVTTANPTYQSASLGNTLDISAANTLIRVDLNLPTRQG